MTPTIKPGVKSTEAWFVLIGAAVMLAEARGLIPEGEVDVWVAIMVSVYTISRTALKVCALRREVVPIESDSVGDPPTVLLKE